ncbi:MAG: hypothetical protein PHW04_00720 [Candidatus Wallbacteria bacterium]|nr:hypothetical protein [Candidatus Wallbacteria bacterium]
MKVWKCKCGETNPEQLGVCSQCGGQIPSKPKTKTLVILVGISIFLAASCLWYYFRNQFEYPLYVLLIILVVTGLMLAILRETDFISGRTHTESDNEQSPDFFSKRPATPEHYESCNEADSKNMGCFAVLFYFIFALIFLISLLFGAFALFTGSRAGCN